jgi:hypothetical protein
MIFAGHIDPLASKIIFKKSKNTQRIVFVNIVCLELIEDNEDEKLHKDFLTEKYINQPEK